MQTNRSVCKGFVRSWGQVKTVFRAQLTKQEETMFLHQRGSSFRTRFPGTDIGSLMMGNGFSDLSPSSIDGNGGGQSGEGHSEYG